MEQKKLLWIVVAAGVFLLVVIGTALVLYAPLKSADPVIASINQPANIAPAQPDPDAWVRNPETVPGFTAAPPQQTPSSGLTIVTDNTTVVSDRTKIDVSGLTAEPQPTQGVDAKQTGEVPMATQGTGTTQMSQNVVIQSPSAEQPRQSPASTQSIPAEKISAQPAAPATKPAEAKPRIQAAAPAKTTVTEYWVQAGSFSDKVKAEQARETLGRSKITSEVFTKDVNGKLFYRVRIGPYKTKTEAEYWLGFIQAAPGFSDSYISEVKTQK